jgi:hypothetical protein
MKENHMHNDSEKTVFSNLEEMLPLIEECLANGQSVNFSPRGISMLPMIRQGKDSVSLSKPPERLKKFDIPLYRRKDGSFVLHRVVKVGETYTCIGDNQFVFEKGIEHDQIIALCTAITRDGKTTSVYSFKWRVYAIFRHYSRFPRRIVRGLCRRIKRLLKFGKV